jgi:hypothetical protein
MPDIAQAFVFKQGAVEFLGQVAGLVAPDVAHSASGIAVGGNQKEASYG